MTLPSTLPPAAAPPPAPAAARAALAETLLDAALQALRSGTFDELVRDHPRAVHWLMRRHARALRSTAGAALAPGDGAAAARWLLRWSVTQLRPDAEPHFEAIADAAWLQQPGWRPMLAAAAVAGFLPVPDFPRVYRRRAGEAPLDNLCGLWGVGASTVYRTLERARHQLAQLLVVAAPDALRRLSLRRFVAAEAMPAAVAADAAARRAWFAAQADTARDAHEPAAELWHRWQAGDAAGFVQVLRGHAAELAAEPETDALVERMAAGTLAPREQLDLWLARAALARTRDMPERELRALEQARQVAHAAQDPLLLGIAQGAFGKYWEPRDADRAFACYQESADFLRDLGPGQGDAAALEAFLTTFARLAWLYLLRNDERSKAVLDRAEALRAAHRVPDAVAGMLEQVWGEYWRRAGDHQRSMEHRHRALNIFERLGDLRSLLATWLNLSATHALRQEYDKAIEYSQKVLAAARAGPVEPEALVNAHMNLGMTRFFQGALAQAIEDYAAALAQAQAASLPLHAFRARYNLAEAHYVRFRDQGDAADEAAGDAYVAAALAGAGHEGNPAALDAVRQLKPTLLNEARDAEPDRLLPGEAAVHFDEMAEVQRQRQLLSVPGEPAAHARAHLAIARAYAAIANKEREAARALVDKHGLGAEFVAELDALRQTFERELTREQQLGAQWQQAAADLVDDAHRAALIAHLLREGAVNKSGYGELRGVAPATASKHLALLAERGLLVQRGKGPATRYELAG